MLAAEAVRQGFETIVAAGGDGTVNEVVNGIGDEPQGFFKSRFAVLPLGTINVFAKELALPLNFEQGWELIRAGKELSIDVPAAEFSADGKTSSRYFAQMAGAGLDSRAIELVDWDLKKKVGGLAYVVAGMKAICQPMPDISVTNGQETFTGKLVLIGNGRYYGGRLNFFPKADLQDGLLEVSIFPRADLEALARCGIGLLTDTLHQFGGAKYLRGTSISLQSAQPVALHLEGENVGHLPAKIYMSDQKLRVIVP
ncbi:MAG: YegS/Rv2252/BmrU family lipid kinase [Verrucomicrobiales bacterium]|nr:YegS/Rv2252/BmrU family lipid kinase [Verrucomicrobiales bacterium]